MTWSKCLECKRCCYNLQNIPHLDGLDQGNGICRYFDRKAHACRIFHRLPEICHFENAQRSLKQTCSKAHFQTQFDLICTDRLATFNANKLHLN